MSEALSVRSVSQRLGIDIASIARDEALDAEIREKAATCLLDAVALAHVARDEATACVASALCDSLEGGLSATVWTTGRKASWGEACMANGIATHGHFHDDSDPSSWCHPGSLVVPAVVAATEVTQGTLEHALHGIVAGYAVLNWIGAEQYLANALIGRGIRTSPTIGAIGAAAGASCAMGLDAGRIAHAVSIAATMSTGTLEPLRRGSDEWRIQNGNAARLGLTSALFARDGVEGAETALEGDKGLVRAVAGLPEAPAAWSEGLDRRAILASYAKPWATLGDNMAAVRAARLMFESGVRAQDIVSGRVTIWHKYTEYPGTSYKGPFDRPVQALASTAFASAAMLLLGDLEYDVSLNRRNDPEILRLVDCLEIAGDPNGTKLDAEVRVQLGDGSIHTTRAADSPRYWLYHDEARSTSVFLQRMSSFLGETRARALAGQVFRLSDSNIPMRDWLGALCN